MKPILFNTDMVKAILEGRKTVTRRLVKPQPREREENPHRLPSGNWFFDAPSLRFPGTIAASVGPYRPPCQPGDGLYVREAWHKDVGRYMYKANYAENERFFRNGKEVQIKWKPSIHMPKEAARIFLRVTDVRVEPLQDISAQDAQREGLAHVFDHLSEDEYRKLRDTTGTDKRKEDWPWNNYLWHGNFGSCGGGNQKTDAWPYQYAGYEDPVGSFSSLWNLLTPLKEWAIYGWEANPWVWVFDFERCEREV